MSTLSAATDLVDAMSERRRGRDPSEQEDRAIAGAYVRESAGDLEDQVLAIRASLVAGSDDPEDNGVVLIARRMNEVLILNYIARRLHVIHQRLLSLYPDIPEALVEEARLLAARCARLRDRMEDHQGDHEGVDTVAEDGVCSPSADSHYEADLLEALADLDRFRRDIAQAV